MIQFSFVFCYFQLLMEIGKSPFFFFFVVQILEVLLYDLSSDWFGNLYLSLHQMLDFSLMLLLLVNLCFVKLILRME